MLFNSHVFLFAFLPLVWMVWRLAAARGWKTAAVAWLTLSSLFFYAWWNPPFVLLILFSIAFNLGWGRLVESGDRPRLLGLGIAVNLGLLAYFKYTGMLLDTVAQLTAWDVPRPEIFLPLGISFFTFQQIAYLVDAHRGLTREHRPLHYALFVTFFPQLIAGPIVHHGQVIPQLQEDETYRWSDRNLAVGLALLAIGLGKKVLLADSVAPWSDALFDGTNLPGVAEAWVGSLAYTFQLYFDFSGYSDMALGLGLLFNVRLPENFDAPYRATSISDFWRRWHMTLSQFLRDYLYIPLGGNRHGRTRRYGNLMATMFLGGLWHGAAWTFALWGGLHGAYLVVNHGWRWLAGRRGWSLPPGVPWLLTFLSVVAGWVVFRAPGLGRAGEVFAGMVGLHGWSRRVPGLDLSGGAWTWPVAWLVGCALITWLAPVSWRWAREPALEGSRRRAVFVGGVLAASVLGLSRVSTFLYFQF